MCSNCNEERAARVEKAMSGYDEGDEAGVVDLLADLRHYCDREGLDFAELDRMAYIHYLEEKET